MQMTNGEMRREAWLILWRGRWFWRLLAAGLLLGAVTFVANELVGQACASCRIPHWGAYLGEYLMMRLDAGALMMVPTCETAWRMTAASGMIVLLGWIFGGCACFGTTLVTARAAAGRAEGWTAGILAGFRAPFTHLALQAMTTLASFFTVGIIAITLVLATGGCCLKNPRSLAMLALLQVVPYSLVWHYFQPLWLVRAAHPDWGVRACLAETRRILKGRRRALLGLLASYWPLPLASLGGMILLALPSTALVAVGALLLPVALGLYVLISCHLRVTTAVFWRECVAAAR